MGADRQEEKKALIEERVKAEGLTIRGWYEDDDGLNADLGRYEVTSDEAEDYGLYEGDEGRLSACVVGAPEYGNVRVMFGFTPEGNDGAEEVHDLTALEPVD